MNPKEVLSNLAKLPQDKITMKISDLIIDLAQLTEEERISRLKGMLEFLFVMSIEDHKKIVRGRFEGLVNSLESNKDIILESVIKTIMKLPNDIKNRELEVANNIIGDVSNPAKELINVFIKRLT